jgi:hypothetical protein
MLEGIRYLLGGGTDRSGSERQEYRANNGLILLVEPRRIELLTSAVRLQRSPS